MSTTLRSVLISDPVDACCGELLVRHGIPVTTKYKLSKEKLIKELQNHEGLIVRSETKVTADVFACCPNLRVVGRAGTGVDNIDLEAATRKGVIVLNTPGGNSISACELTCALISNLARNVTQAVQSLKDGRWDRKLYSGFELSGKTLAVLGMGRIGREVTRRMQAYGMRVIAFDPLLTSEDANYLNVEKFSLDEIWPMADYITVHTPLIPQTKNLINATTLAKCKKGVRIINVARGGIVDEEALLNALKSGHCAGAALDVFTEEPPKNSVILELIAHPKVISTPHLGASTEEAQQRVAEEIAQQFLVLAGRSTEYVITGIVNAPMLSAAISDENASWIELSKKLGNLISRILKGKLNITVHNQIIGNKEMEKKTFIHTAVLVGILSGQTKNGLNLINAPTLAQEIGIDIKRSYEESTNIEAIVIQAEGHWIKGTVRNNKPMLLSLDDALFSDGIILGDFISLYQTSNIQDLAQIVNVFSLKNINICNLNTNGNWMIIQTDREVSIPVNGIESF
ncbi:D-3-phosphoglycerate dehydrogenase [Apis mellifera caucasica]|uniref:D-3-phosphoglycerate dehydrogenase n=1 Tax=Apis mellifera TaxID=7460 RepID=A0A7M7GMK2_APIME|nr:D-3-phosphoglycerate dehydrogenase [Apis mellifera]XP_006559599.1 D-3-phosphoglycerate dehydrogenase [Apis mellifera]KAG6803090.1 D-3-phosphoglycerate dehydrogenase [Apis mellifera caucasica]KAG9431746.1 D-3-phosphoglycerate dehydrogenase [Apis mellifera carnica]|eukprot:XP_006559598.1 D-3-phosphoglycerate dehydrogenase [Apis mellifera]